MLFGVKYTEEVIAIFKHETDQQIFLDAVREAHDDCADDLQPTRRKSEDTPWR